MPCMRHSHVRIIHSTSWSVSRINLKSVQDEIPILNPTKSTDSARNPDRNIMQSIVTPNSSRSRPIREHRGNEQERKGSENAIEKFEGGRSRSRGQS